MGKIISSSEYVVNVVDEVVAEAGLASYGITVETMSTTKSKNPVKVSKANSTTEYLTKTSDVVCVEVYEAAFERLDDEMQKKLIEMYISAISYDSEKDKLTIQNNQFLNMFNMCRKYGDEFIHVLESAYIAIQQIEDEEKEAKEREKEAKAAKKKQKQNM